jgi:hypothetical protein
MSMLRIVHPRQQGSRLSQFDSLFEQVERVAAFSTHAQESVPVPDVRELEFPVLTDSVPASSAQVWDCEA